MCWGWGWIFYSVADPFFYLPLDPTALKKAFTTTAYSFFFKYIHI